MEKPPLIPASWRAVLPVLDIFGGQVVRGVAGERAKYRPIVSRWTTSTTPLEVACALRSAFGFTEFYLADLDGIQHAKPQIDILKQLRDEGLDLWIDAGLTTLKDAEPIAPLGHLVLGLETLRGPASLRAFLDAFASRSIFSLDMKAGQGLGQPEYWPSQDPWEVAKSVIDLGVRRMIVLDLARVGVGEGVGTEALCRRLRDAYPFLEIIAGGGVRNWVDVDSLVNHGADRVLIASALHDGRIRTKGEYEGRRVNTVSLAPCPSHSPSEPRSE